MNLDPAKIVRRHLAVMTRPPVSTPCNHFPDGPLLGNGDMTVVAGGRADLQQFHIGKSDFWTDGEGWDFTNEEYDRYVVSPITVGGVRVWVRDFACASYRQEIDLHAAQMRGRFVAQGWTLHTCVWTPATENLLVLELKLEADSDLAPLGLHVRTWVKGNDDPRRASLPVATGRSGDVAWASRQTWNRGRWVARAALATRVLGVASHAWPAGEPTDTALMLRPGEQATVVTVLHGGKDADHPEREAISRCDRLTPQQLTKLREAHRHWWDAFWRRSLIDLGGDMVERYWYGAQYALACCARPGRVCPGLFGFSTDDHPRWNGDYHLNYNAQQPFAGVFSSNRGEWAEPFIDVINQFMEEGRRRAATDLEPPQHGVYYPIGLGPWGVAAQDDYMGQKCAAAFAATIFIDHFRYQRDLDYARIHLYPFVREVARFWEGYLRREGNRLVIRGSAAHEHGGDEVNPALDLALVRRVFSGILQISEALDLDADQRQQWRAILSQLSSYPTLVHERKEVFRQSESAAGFTRSITLLNLGWPGGGDIGPDGDPHWTTVLRETLDAIDRWDQGNCFAWTLIAAVRTGHPQAYERFVTRLNAPDGLRENLTVAQAYGGLETCGATLAVNEMLMQSESGIIRLFPVWPRHRNAGFHQLRAVGGFLVSAAVMDGHVQPFSITSTHGGRVRVASPWGSAPVSVTTHRNHQTVLLQPDASNLIALHVERGQTLEVGPANA